MAVPYRCSMSLPWRTTWMQELQLLSAKQSLELEVRTLKAAAAGTGAATLGVAGELAVLCLHTCTYAFINITHCR